MKGKHGPELTYSRYHKHVVSLYIYNIDRSNLHGEAPGLDRPGRTCMAYCLLSKAPQSSEECFSTALEAHLANLDPNMRITTSVVSVPLAQQRFHGGWDQFLPHRKHRGAD